MRSPSSLASRAPQPWFAPPPARLSSPTQAHFHFHPPSPLAWQGQEGCEAGAGVPHPGVRPAARVDRRRGEAGGGRLEAGGRAHEARAAAGCHTVALTMPSVGPPPPCQGAESLPTSDRTSQPALFFLLLHQPCRTSTVCAPPRPPPPATTPAPPPTAAAAPHPSLCPSRPLPPLMPPPLPAAASECPLLGGTQATISTFERFDVAKRDVAKRETPPL